MSVRNLKYLFQPRSIVLIGASDEAQSVGAVIANNLLSGGFKGPLAVFYADESTGPCQRGPIHPNGENLSAKSQPTTIR